MLQAQGWQKHLHCTEKPHFARQSGSKSFYGGLRKLSCRLLLIELERTTRKPRLLFRLFGLLLFRLDTVQLEALLFQEPPRLTRLEPEAAPVFTFLFGLPFYSIKNYSF